MIKPLRISFIGFGEVASCLGRVLRERGGEIAAHDALLEQDGGRAILLGRPGGAETAFLPLRETVENANYILSTVTTQAATAVAGRCAGLLRPGQIYVDLNSTSPGVKVEMARTIGAAGAGFVEGAILGAIGATGAATRILLGGERAGETAAVLTRLGLNAVFYSLEIGKASTFKMLRSIFSKGLEALLIELLVAGRRAGMEEDLWRDIMDLFTAQPFERVAANWVRTHAGAHERRYHEMVQVAETMREIGVEPVMTAATEGFFRRSLSLGLDKAFPTKPDTMEEVIGFLEGRLR